MALLLNIDTATPYGAVALCNDDKVIHAMDNLNQKDHASFVHVAIESVAKQSAVSLSQIDAIVVTIGPGSYTGLRVGLSAAKGICYALQKPLIGVNTLQAIALAALQHTPPLTSTRPTLYAPMIDARRMEVFTALYNDENKLVKDAQAIVVDETFFASELAEHCLVFAGDGSKKLDDISLTGEFVVSNAMHSIRQVAQIGAKHFQERKFEDVAYCEPFYLKPFFSGFVKK